MRKKVGYILTIAVVAMTVIGVLLWFNIKGDGNLKDKTTVTFGGETTKTLKAEIAGFYPGKSADYTIEISDKNAADYNVSLVFRKNEDVEPEKNTLGNYLTVRIVAGDVTFEKNLNELFGGETINLGRNSQKITITYTMPLEIGNEAQGAEARFFIDLTVSEEGDSGSVKDSVKENPNASSLINR